QDQLVRTEKLRALGEMASWVAHDFNNLLASLLGRAQLLMRRVQDPQQLQWLRVIERSALDGAQTVRRLQEFTRIRRDQPMVPLDVTQMVRDALDITQSRWREEPVSRGVAIEVRTELAAVPPILGDAAELREALTNLILNAVDAMPTGGALAGRRRARAHAALPHRRRRGGGAHGARRRRRVRRPPRHDGRRRGGGDRALPRRGLRRGADRPRHAARLRLAGRARREA